MAGEGRLWERWRGRLAEDFFVQRIENLVGEGVPDVHLLRRQDGSQHWLELKSVPVLPVRAATRVFGTAGLRADQIAWLYGRAHSEGSVWILASAADWTFFISGIWARGFNSMALSELQDCSAYAFVGKVSGEHYLRVSKILRY